jgi:glutamate--cysteine ligase
VYHLASERLARLCHQNAEDVLHSRLMGLEKESLRVNPEGGISQKPHPRTLGSTLTHPWITTDYSEALCEFITPPCTSIDDALAFLADTQSFVYQNLDNEVLWATSMPCVLAGEQNIPIAQYGTSNQGLMKTIYRRGLGYRYGRTMQVIAGVHFNYSWGESFWECMREVEAPGQPLRPIVDAGYMGLLRNLQRFGWLIPYLFGASPAICKSYLHGHESDLSEFDANTCFEPYATSLRMGDIGYTNTREGETGIKANYDSLGSYVDSLVCAISTPCREYEAIGVEVDGEYRQLNSNILQIENEYYSSVRPKQILLDNEKPTHALRERGIRYVELRSLDVNAFDPLGINEMQLRFLEVFMLFSLLQDSPAISQVERESVDRNLVEVAHQGRKPGLRLRRNGDEVELRRWASELCEAMRPFAEFLDGAQDAPLYSQALDEQCAAVDDPERTPSARMLNEMRANGESFYHFAKRMSLKHQRYFLARKLSAEREDFFRREAEESLAAQLALEAGNTQRFDEFLTNYFAQP